MLTEKEIYIASRHSVANIIAKSGKQRFGSGTGFIVNGHLVSCAHVVKVPSGLDVEVRFEYPDTSATQSWTYSTNLPFKGFSDENSHDFAILGVPSFVKLGPSLEFSEQLPVPGDKVCSLGYPFEDPNLTIHQGIVSAVYRSGPATILKLDMSVNPSNSGGPLISMADGKVVGIVARKATGLTKAFDSLIQSFNKNMKVLEAASGSVTLSGIDPLQVLAITQQQMQSVSEEIKRSANVGIGYAIWVDPLRHEAAFNV
ncbi:MAG: serine protease [Sphingorhabdus sp.]|uniref:S1 family peptidase n=1 Tax=Sphingorhabdus sp. TaxID=1902408 RepID=UPI0038FCC50D